jgi:cytochrome oxidase assembly protein ShyY1
MIVMAALILVALIMLAAVIITKPLGRWQVHPHRRFEQPDTMTAPDACALPQRPVQPLRGVPAQALLLRIELWSQSGE